MIYIQFRFGADSPYWGRKVSKRKGKDSTRPYWGRKVREIIICSTFCGRGCVTEGERLRELRF